MSLEIPENATRIESKTATHWVDQYGILFSITKDVRMDYQMMKESIAFFHEHFKNTKYLGVIESTNLKLMDKRTRLLAADEIKKNYIAVAIVSQSAMSRTLGNILFALTKDEVPKKAFKNEVDAKAWLLKIDQEVVIKA